MGHIIEEFVMTYIIDGPYHGCRLFTPPLEASRVKPSHGLHLSDPRIWKSTDVVIIILPRLGPSILHQNLTYVVGIWNRMEGKGTHLVGPIGWSRKSLANGQPWTKWGGKKTIGMGALWFDTPSIYPSKGHHLLEKEGGLHTQSKQAHQVSPLVKGGVRERIRLSQGFVGTPVVFLPPYLPFWCIHWRSQRYS